jgi:hypothetical protein
MSLTRPDMVEKPDKARYEVSDFSDDSMMHSPDDPGHIEMHMKHTLDP